MENGRFQKYQNSMNKLNAQQIVEDFKNNYFDMNFDIKYQDNIPAELVGFYKKSHIFVFSFFDKSVSFNNLYQNYVYHKYIKPTLQYNERFFIESEGVKFDYNLHRSLLLKIITKIVIGFKKYYICNKEEEINEDFKCGT